MLGVLPVKLVYTWGNNHWAKLPAIPQKNVRFSCYEGFSIFSTNFKGNKNVT